MIMPKVYLNQKDRLNDRLASWVFGQLKLKRITQKQLAEQLEITQQGLSYKLKVRQFTFSDFITLVDVFEPDASEVAWLVGK